MGRKPVRADDDDDLTSRTGGSATKQGLLRKDDGDGATESERPKRRRITPSAVVTPNTLKTASRPEETKRQRQGPTFVRVEGTSVLGSRGGEEEDDDNLVIKRLRESVAPSKQAAVKGWMANNGLRSRGIYKNGVLRKGVRVTAEGDLVWGLRAKTVSHVAQLEVGGIFEAKGKGCVAYLRMDTVAWKTNLGGKEETEDGDDDECYLGWVFLGLSQLLDKQAKAKATVKGEQKAGRHEVYLVVVPRNGCSVIRLYSGSMTQEMLNMAEGKKERENLRLRVLRGFASSAPDLDTRLRSGTPGSRGRGKCYSEA
ncbi:hypothetical protein MY11210_007627 [Beauveria gryllotalpidicola]